MVAAKQKRFKVVPPEPRAVQGVRDAFRAHVLAAAEAEVPQLNEVWTRYRDGLQERVQLTFCKATTCIKCDTIRDGLRGIGYVLVSAVAFRVE